MSGYFRDRVQGAGAIAANAPAPRAAPAPMLRRGVGYVAAGAVRIDDEGGDSGGGRGPAPRAGVPFTMPTRTGTKAPPVKSPALFAPARTSRAPTIAPAPVVRSPRSPVTPLQVVRPKMIPAALTQTLTAAPPAVAAVLTSSAPPKSQTILASGGGGASAAPTKAASSLPGLISMAPDDGGGDELVQSATTAVAPPGAAKLWILMGLGGTAAFLAYRHFSKRKGRR